MPILNGGTDFLKRVASFKLRFEIRLKITLSCSLERQQRYMTPQKNESNIVAGCYRYRHAARHALGDLPVFGISVLITGSNQKREGGENQNLHESNASLAMMMGISPGCHGGYFFITASKGSEFNKFFNQCCSDT